MGVTRTQTSSVEYTANKTFAVDPMRNYLLIVFTAGAGTIEFGGGGGKIPLTQGAFYEPFIVPTSQFTVETTGTFVLHTVASTHASAV